jgi:hypothetical protein
MELVENENIDYEKNAKEFHAVEFMRKRRRELTAKYLKDKKQFKADLNAVVEEFKKKRKEKHPS